MNTVIELIEWAARYSEDYPFLRKKILDIVLAARDKIDEGSSIHYETEEAKTLILTLIEDY